MFPKTCVPKIASKFIIFINFSPKTQLLRPKFKFLGRRDLRRVHRRGHRARRIRQHGNYINIFFSKKKHKVCFCVVQESFPQRFRNNYLSYFSRNRVKTGRPDASGNARHAPWHDAGLKKNFIKFSEPDFQNFDAKMTKIISKFKIFA